MRFNRFNKLVNLQIKNYLKYAIGGVLLVIVTTLVALQDNNWNEERKLKLDSLMYYISISDWIYLADEGVLTELILDN